MPCPCCGRGFHDECHTNCEDCHPVNLEEESIAASIGGKVKDPENVTDRHSTGRKRAAYLYPIFKEKPCEWRGKKNCGGGLHPIVGCIKGSQQHRHHGPVKDTLRNEEGNVHRICSTCHARWHAKNDESYTEEEFAKHPHNPEDATEDELLINDAHYKVANKRYWEGRD